MSTTRRGFLQAALAVVAGIATGWRPKLAEAAPTPGGYLVPPEYRARLMEALAAPCGRGSPYALDNLGIGKGEWGYFEHTHPLWDAPVTVNCRCAIVPATAKVSPELAYDAQRKQAAAASDVRQSWRGRLMERAIYP